MTGPSAPETEIPETDDKPRLSFIERMRRVFDGTSDAIELLPEQEPCELSAPVRVAWSTGPFRLTLGKTTMELHPDSEADDRKRGGQRDWIVHPGEEFYRSLTGFLRICPGDNVILGREDDVQTAIFDYSKSIARRHVEITNRNGELTLKPLDPDRLCAISFFPESNAPQKLLDQRRRNLERLTALLGHPFETFDRDDALERITRVNRILAEEAFRERDADGNPGGILELPEDLTPLIVGDIHTRIDNLLKVVVEGGFVEALERNDACLVLLGDLVHSQEPGELEEMDSSILILDTFLMLKERFPANVFYIRGNHESFSPDVGKGGVAQGVLLRKHLKKVRGKAFLSEVETLFEQLPFVVQNAQFAACHGAPTRSDVNRESLVNIQRYPGLQHEIVWNRVRQGNRPGGYTKGSVKRFRRTLGLPKHAPVIVAHTPLSNEDTVWLDVTEISGHHVVYSAHLHVVGAMILIGNRAVPLEYAAEPLISEAEPEEGSG